MRAEFIQQTYFSITVTERNKILSHKPNANRFAVCDEFFRHQGRDPVAAHHLAHWRIAFNTAQEIILFGGQHKCLQYFFICNMGVYSPCNFKLDI
jgi:hypothetical protein